MDKRKSHRVEQHGIFYESVLFSCFRIQGSYLRSFLFDVEAYRVFLDLYFA